MPRMIGTGIRERSRLVAGEKLANLNLTLSVVKDETGMDGLDTDPEEATSTSLKTVCFSPFSIVRVFPTRSPEKRIRPESRRPIATAMETGGRYLTAGTVPPGLVFTATPGFDPTPRMCHKT